VADHRNGAMEEIHLPGPTLVPLFAAIGITLALVGPILSWWFVGAGGAITLLALGAWIRDVRADIERLPADHQR
jgi:hypothetical protein